MSHHIRKYTLTVATCQNLTISLLLKVSEDHGLKAHCAEEGFTAMISIQMAILQLAENSGWLLADRCIFMVEFSQLTTELTSPLKSHLPGILLGVARSGVWAIASRYLFTITLLAS